MKEVSPDLSFVAGGDEVITSSYLEQVAQSDGLAVRFKWEMGKRAVLYFSSLE